MYKMCVIHNKEETINKFQILLVIEGYLGSLRW